jgi:uncharacterized protein (TIGR02996 family)
MTADSAELKGMLAHCAGTPDDTARLVLADWLEDHDDFRAEFVRLAVEFDRTPPHDIRRFQQSAQLRALLETPAFEQWLPATPCFEWGWRRGLLTFREEECNLAEIDLTEVAGWLGSNWIERVEFEGGYEGVRWEDTFGLARNARELDLGIGNYGPGRDALTRLRDWPHLRGLRMCEWGGEKAWVELATLPHLRALTLENPDWTIMPALPKARLPNLEVLYLDKEWNADLPHWADCFPKLRSLTLTQYNAYPDEQCERFVECSQLRHLALYQKYEPFTRVGLNALAKLKELRSLTLGRVPRGTIAGLAKLTKLERLGVYGEVQLIRGLESLPQLRWLSLAVGTLTQDMAAQVLKLPHLTRLDLCHAEAGAIAALAKAPALRILTVWITNEHLPVAELVQLEQLQYLRVGGYEKLPKPELLSLQTALPACRIVNAWRDRDEGEYDWS